MKVKRYTGVKVKRYMKIDFFAVMYICMNDTHVYIQLRDISCKYAVPVYVNMYG